MEKQSKYAFYHPFAEAIGGSNNQHLLSKADAIEASMICDLPSKILTAIGFGLTLYFMTNLRRTPGHFFVFLLFSFTCTLTMSMYFRCIAALSRTFPQVKLSFHLLCFHANDSGYGTGFYLQSSSCYIYGLYDSEQGHAPLVSMDQLSEPCQLCFRSSNDQ